MVDKSKRSIEEIKVVSQGYLTDVTTEIAKEIEAMKKKTKLLSILFAVVSCCLIAGIVVLYCR